MQNDLSLPAYNHRMSCGEDDEIMTASKGCYAAPIEVSNLSAYQSHAIVSRQTVANVKTIENKDS